MAHLTLYFDDSGTHLESPVAIAATWIFSCPRRKRFERDLEAVRAKYHFKCFHASECLAGNKRSDFANWTYIEKAKLFRRIAQLCLQTASQGFSFAVIKEDYDELVKNPLREKMGKFHYTWAIHVLLAMIESWRLNRTVDPAEFVLDYMSNDTGQREKRGEVERIFDRFAQKPDALRRYGISNGCFSFRDKCDVTPLQASDLLAWSTMQRAHNELTGRTPKDIAIEIHDFFSRSANVYIAIANREQLRKAVADALKNPDYAHEPYINPRGGFPHYERGSPAAHQGERLR